MSKSTTKTAASAATAAAVTMTTPAQLERLGEHPRQLVPPEGQAQGRAGPLTRRQRISTGWGNLNDHGWGKFGDP